MTQYSANARSWFGPGWTSYIQIKTPAATTVSNQGADRAFPNGQYGIMIPQVYGQGRVNGNILWYGETVPSAAPVGTTTAATGASSYAATFAVAICKGPIHHIIRIWADDLLVYDATADGPSSLYGTSTIYLGDETQTPDSVMESFEGSGNVPGYRGLAYVVFDGLPIADFGGRIPAFSFEVQAQTSASVESVLNAMAAQTGLETTDFDFGCLDQTVTGYIITTRVAAKQHLDQLLNVFAGDLVEFDGKLQIVQRGGDALATVAAADLGAKLWQGHDTSPTAAVVTQRVQDLEIPFALDINYYSTNKGYDRTTTRAVRYDKTDVQGAQTVDTYLVLDEDQARNIAERLLYQQWIERNSYTFSLMVSYLKFVPGAVLNLPVDGEELRVRLVQMDIGLFGPIGCTAVLDDVGILTQSVPGATVETSAPGIAVPVATDFLAFDSIEFSDADAASAGFYVAVTGPTAWRSADIYYSTDGGTSYARAATTAVRSVFGHASTTLADGATAGVFDLTSTVTVVLDIAGSLSSTSSASVSDGVNWALVGNELLGFTTATLTDPVTRTYTLSGLLRGLRGTPMTGHTHPERFVLANTSVVRVPVASSLIGTTVKVKAYATGITPGTVTAQDVLIGTPHLVGSGLTSGAIDAIEAGVTAANPGYAALLNALGTDFVYSPAGDFILVPI